ncbi:hypothetical protein [Deinococcus sp.]|uniref:hypothetical protein n=1 Tax=Deinococcus sp. TaxID=47478 RepID=UPI0025C1EB1D|nr:hypothetical protein [Deinococcus sp.]
MLTLSPLTATLCARPRRTEKSCTRRTSWPPAEVLANGAMPAERVLDEAARVEPLAPD